MTRRRHKKSRGTTPPPFELHLSPETRRGISVIFFFTLAAILLLALLGTAGQGGRFLARALTGFAGAARYLIPPILAAIAVLILSQPHRGRRTTSMVGLFLFFIGITGFLETIRTFSSNISTRGGFLGLVVSKPLVAGLGSTAAAIIFLAVMLAAILLIGNTSLAALARHSTFLGRIVALFARIFKRHEDHTPRILEGGEPVSTVEHFKEPSFNTREVAEKKPVSIPTAKEDTGSEFSRGLTHRRPAHRVDIPLDLLEARGAKPSAGDIKHNMEIIEKTLAHFGIPIEMGDVSVGPTVSQYTFKPQEGVKLTKVTALQNDLALALAAHPLRMEAPIPGKSLVGLEVPNQTVATVGLREVLEAPAFRERATNLLLALGKDVAGTPWLMELTRMPHLLVAGATGSGKTVCLNALIVGLLYQNDPNNLKLILIDPKRVELPAYNGIPHLLVPTITDVPKTVNALKWTITEMERRFLTLQKFGARDIGSYNAQAEEKMPAIVVVVDELADLMAAAASDVESSIIRIAQMARAVGIHLILATQRPSVDVITGLIKANIPARIAFAVASQTDSRTILDASGAEKLLGRGDLLFTAPELSKPRRLQGAFVGEEEIKRIVSYLKTEYEGPEYDTSITEKQQRTSTVFNEDAVSDEDPLIPEAKEVILQADKASASLLQRRLKVGYARAARLLDLLEKEGFIGPGDGAKPREVLVRGGSGAVMNPPEDIDDEMPPWE